MIICPNCRNESADAATKCVACDWTLQTIEEVPVYLSNTDKADPMLKAYIENYDVLSDEELAGRLQPNLYQETQCEKLFSYIGQIENLSVCEVGIGKGILLDKIIAAKPKELFGIDVSVNFLKRYNNLKDNQIFPILANAENLPFYNRFDLMVASDILEHVMNVGDFLYSSNKSLKQGGNLVIRVPYNENLMMYSRHLGCEYQFAHLRNFCKKTLETNLKYAGFEINKLHYDGYWAYKTRPIFRKWEFISKHLDKMYEKYFPNEFDINCIDNRIGRILMEPAEITAVCTKVSEL
jgi:2-polyprenyl-3-methyl-5-hydroxy-6-metoxy-1,4-benzoquinol methylase